MLLIRTAMGPPLTGGAACRLHSVSQPEEARKRSWSRLSHLLPLNSTRTDCQSGGRCANHPRVPQPPSHHRTDHATSLRDPQERSRPVLGLRRFPAVALEPSTTSAADTADPNAPQNEVASAFGASRTATRDH